MIDKLKNIRIGAIDFGLKRIGLAYTDEMHISINSYATIDNTPISVFKKIEIFIKETRIGAFVIGFPQTKDGKENKIHNEIKTFAKEISERYSLEVFFIDEYNSSNNAKEIMIDNGIKKQKRARKGTIDKIAACIILNNFINDIEG